MFPMEAIVNPPSRGSRLDADHPRNGVLIPCRFTFLAYGMSRSIGQRSTWSAGHPTSTPSRGRIMRARENGEVGRRRWLAMPPLPHHRAYGSVPRRFDWVKLG